jgi:hypothetical protein
VIAEQQGDRRVMAPIDLNDDNEEDDFFGNQEDDQLAAKESAAEAHRLETAGYHESYEASHTRALQAGFDAGFMESYDRSVEIGRCLGKLVAQTKLTSGGHGVMDDVANSRYLAVVTMIRERLIALTTTTESTTAPSSDTLERLEADVRRTAEDGDPTVS